MKKCVIFLCFTLVFKGGTCLYVYNFIERNLSISNSIDVKELNTSLENDQEVMEIIEGVKQGVKMRNGERVVDVLISITGITPLPI